MSFVRYNANPIGRNTVDCTIRALAHFLDSDWDTEFARLSVYSYVKKDMPVVNDLWIGYLWSMGYRPNVIPDTCPDCYTVRDFCMDHPLGKYLIATDGHVLSIENGDYYDTWDSGDETPYLYWKRR